MAAAVLSELPATDHGATRLNQTNSGPGSRASDGRGADVSKTRLGKKGSTTTESAANARKKGTPPIRGAIQPNSIGPMIVPTDRKKKPSRIRWMAVHERAGCPTP